MKKSRFLYLHPEANPGKVAALDALQEAYATYLGVCIEAMIKAHRSCAWTEIEMTAQPGPLQLAATTLNERSVRRDQR